MKIIEQDIKLSREETAELFEGIEELKAFKQDRDKGILSFDLRIPMGYKQKLKRYVKGFALAEFVLFVNQTLTEEQAKRALKDYKRACTEMSKYDKREYLTFKLPIDDYWVIRQAAENNEEGDFDFQKLIVIAASIWCLALLDSFENRVRLCF